MTALTPSAAFLGGKSLAPMLLVRVLLGLGEGVAFPALMSLIRREVPVELAPDETVILLHPPSTFSRCINSDGEGLAAE